MSEAEKMGDGTKQDRPIKAKRLEDVEHANVTFRISPQPSRPKLKLLRIRKNRRQCLKLQAVEVKFLPNATGGIARSSFVDSDYWKKPSESSTLFHSKKKSSTEKQ